MSFIKPININNELTLEDRKLHERAINKYLNKKLKACGRLLLKLSAGQYSASDAYNDNVLVEYKLRDSVYNQHMLEKKKLVRLVKEALYGRRGNHRRKAVRNEDGSWKIPGKEIFYCVTNKEKTIIWNLTDLILKQNTQSVIRSCPEASYDKAGNKTGSKMVDKDVYLLDEADAVHVIEYNLEDSLPDKAA